MLQRYTGTGDLGRTPLKAAAYFAQQPAPAPLVLFQGALAYVGKGKEIYREGDPTDCLYKVQTGAVCTHKILMDGRRQIASFYLPGDVFGFESGETQSFTAEAIATTALLPAKRTSILLFSE